MRTKTTNLKKKQLLLRPEDIRDNYFFLIKFAEKISVIYYGGKFKVIIFLGSLRSPNCETNFDHHGSYLQQLLVPEFSKFCAVSVAIRAFNVQ